MINDNTVKYNPYDYSRPVSEPSLFAGRTDELMTIRELLIGLKGIPGNSPVIMLSGERRVGKTSILYRIEEFCTEESILTARFSVTESVVSNSWNFWQVLFEAMFNSMKNIGIDISAASNPPIGFNISESDTPSQSSLRFPLYYANQRLVGTPITQSLIDEDFKLVSDLIRKKDYKAITLIIDEAHLLVDLNEIQQQLRDMVACINKCGIVFAGEPLIAKMINDDSNRFYHQGTVLQINNFQDLDDVAECAIQPLTKQERMLMSPMTIDYLLKLSQGKPNQIRLICSSIYSRYMNNKQDDLNININILNEMLGLISSQYTDYDLNKLVEKVQSLNSVDLEILYRVTRYPNWTTEEIIDLDESFRGETESTLSRERRKRVLSEKREEFINDGLLQDLDERCVLAGDEFTYLYVRFLYEIRKYGDLSKRLELGKGPPKPFSEKVDKLVKSLVFELGRIPRIRLFNHYQFNIDRDAIRSKVRQRFEVLQKLILGETLEDQGIDERTALEIIGDCSQICELVKETGKHHFISLLVRNAQDVNEIMHVELYFDPIYFEPISVITLVPPSTKKLLEQQANAANIWLEDIDDFSITNLPNLCDLLKFLGAPALEEILKNANDVIEWRIGSVQHIVTSEEAQEDSIEAIAKGEAPTKQEPEEETTWLSRYDSDDEKGAIEILNKRISECTDIKDNPKLANYYNDLGYIKSTPKINMIRDAKKDLQRAIAYHFVYLELSLLNLAVINIDEEDYPEALSNIEKALFIATSRENIITGYLKLRLPTHSITPIHRIEQHPANVIEASYINMAYALLKTNHPGQAIEAIEEGLALFPNSYRLKHAKARIFLSRNQAPLADEIYEELGKMNISDPILDKEVRGYVQRFILRKRRTRGHRR